MRWLGLALRIVGWLLTPLVAWAASFLGATLGAVLARGIGNPTVGLVVTALAAAAAGFAAIFLWLRLLRRSPEIRETLALDEEGLPVEEVEP